MRGSVVTPWQHRTHTHTHMDLVCCPLWVRIICTCRGGPKLCAHWSLSLRNDCIVFAMHSPTRFSCDADTYNHQDNAVRDNNPHNHTSALRCVCDARVRCVSTSARFNVRRALVLEPLIIYICLWYQPWDSYTHAREYTDARRLDKNARLTSARVRADWNGLGKHRQRLDEISGISLKCGRFIP